MSLYKIGEHYFVRDGNHRVSVARFHGAPAIDAEVVEMRGRMRTNDAQPEAGPVAPPTRRDLHDGLGAQLGGLNVQAGTLRRLIPQDPAAADEMVVELREELRGAISDIRRLVYDLRPPALDDLGLAGALRRLAERYGSNGDQPHVLVKAPDDLPTLPAAVEVAVYRIAQEGLTNAARHAKANSCVVRLSVNHAVTLEVVDDGVGIPAGRNAGVGLSSMRERASELGGSCVVQSVPEGGTRVLVRLPLTRG